MTESPQASGLGPIPFREFLSDAIRHWERRRILYNLALIVEFVGWQAFTWPHFRATFTLQSFLQLFMAAVFLNVCYCAAYLADVPMQCSSFRDLWQRWRWGLWLVGALFAASLEFSWITNGNYPAVG